VAKTDRESTEIEIFRMQGIRAHVLAVHYGEGYGDLSAAKCYLTFFG
jgi:hypothetical protein